MPSALFVFNNGRFVHFAEVKAVLTENFYIKVFFPDDSVIIYNRENIQSFAIGNIADQMAKVVEREAPDLILFISSKGMRKGDEK